MMIFLCVLLAVLVGDDLRVRHQQRQLNDSWDCLAKRWSAFNQAVQIAREELLDREELTEKTRKRLRTVFDNRGDFLEPEGK